MLLVHGSLRAVTRASSGATSRWASLSPFLRHFATQQQQQQLRGNEDQTPKQRRSQQQQQQQQQPPKELDFDRNKQWLHRVTRHYQLIDEYKIRSEEIEKVSPKPYTDLASWEKLMHKWEPENEINVDEMFQKVGIDWNDPSIAIDSRYSEEELAKPLKLERGRVRKLSFNNPHTMNSIDLEMLRSLETHLPKWEHWDTVRGILWLSQHESMFSAGADVRKLASYSESEWEEYFRLQARFHYFLANSRLPLVPVPDGMALGFGAALVLNSPVAFATDKTTVASPAVAYGFIPDCGLSYTFSRLGSLGRFLALTTYQLTGEDLLALRLVRFFGTSDHAKSVEVALDTVYSNNPERFVYSLLACCSNPADPPIERFAQIIERCFSNNTVEAIIDALEKETDPWAKEQLATMKEMCPLSQKVTLSMLQKAEKLSLKECLLNEYRLALKFRTLPEFVNGVKARVLNEIPSPNWRSLSQISDAEVESLFTKTKNDENILEGVRISTRRAPLRSVIEPIFAFEETTNATWIEQQGQPIPLTAKEIIAKFIAPGEELPEIDSRIDKELNETKQMQTETTSTTVDHSSDSQQRTDTNDPSSIMRKRKRLISKLSGTTNTENSLPLAWDDRY